MTTIHAFKLSHSVFNRWNALLGDREIFWQGEDLWGSGSLAGFRHSIQIIYIPCHQGESTLFMDQIGPFTFSALNQEFRKILSILTEIVETTRVGEDTLEIISKIR